MKSIQKLWCLLIATMLLTMTAHAGRWITRDPMDALQHMERDPHPSLGLDLNAYTFVGNSPPNWVDPLGLAWYDRVSGAVNFAPYSLIYDPNQFVSYAPLQKPDPNTFGAMHGIDTTWMDGEKPGDFVADRAKDVAKGSLKAGVMFLPFGAEEEEIYTAADSALEAANAAKGARCFRSFRALKRAFPNSPGKIYHHIVEQRDANIAKFGVEAIQNMENVVEVAPEINQALADYYSSIRPFTGGQTVRQWLGGQSFGEQYAFGMRALGQVLSGQPLP